jgi:hypothetical protein
MFDTSVQIYRRRILKVTCAFALSICASALFAETCDSKEIVLRDRTVRSRLELITEISEALHTSVLWELSTTPSIPEEYRISSNTVPTSLAGLLQIIDTSGSLVCTVGDSVIHIYSPQVLGAEENPLNHIFHSFSVPSTAELFSLSFKIRLAREAFRPQSAEFSSGSTGGALPSNASNTALKPETVLNVSARDLFIREAQQAPMMLLGEITIDPRQTPLTLWEKNRRKLTVTVLGRSTPKSQ